MEELQQTSAKKCLREQDATSQSILGLLMYRSFERCSRVRRRSRSAEPERPGHEKGGPGLQPRSCRHGQDALPRCRKPFRFV